MNLAQSKPNKFQRGKIYKLVSYETKKVFSDVTTSLIK